MPSLSFRVNRTARALAVVLVALVAGSGAARADEADVDASEAPQTSPWAGEADVPEAPQAPEAPEAPQAPQMSARAGEADVPEAPRTTRTSWYGWQTLLADAGVIALWSAAYAVDEAKYGSSSPQSYDRGTNLLVASGVAVYFLGGPAIHWAHGHGRKGLGSLGLRVGLPLGGLIAGALLGSVACGSGDNEFVPCPAVIGALGFLGGAVAAPIVDAAVVAREPVTQPADSQFQAAFVPSGGGGTFVLAGRF
jgi:hypothetical protein